MMFSSFADTPPPTAIVWQQEIGPWRVEFDPSGAQLRCVHAESGAELSGALAFAADIEGKPQTWQVVLPRDSVKSRLALLDTEGNVQGYVTFTGSGDSLNIQPIHRTAQNYPGMLTFSAVARLGGETFACRTRPPADTRVVQMAAGPADSHLNDSLFDIAQDTVLRFNAQSAAIYTEETAAAFRVALSASIAASADAAMTLEILKEYYRGRYVPYYQPRNKVRCPKAPTGWMSWNVYFDTAGEKENLDEARAAAQFLKPYGMEFFSIESWQDNSPELPVSKFYNLTLRPDPNKFPSGMKWLAEQIRALGFRPGIWTVPFGTGDAQFYAAHTEWFLHDADGQPMRNWCGLYVIDPSQEAVRRHMEETHRIMSQEWGYEYFKIDGMSGRNAGYSAHFYERDDVRAAFKEPVEDPFQLCVKALRRGIGPDRVLLACQGHYTGPDAAYADAGRIGADIVAHRRPPDWHNYLNQARTTLNQLFVNNIVWFGDPDTLLVGTANPLETVRLAASVVALSGQAMFAGDKLAELPPERMRLLQQCLPVCDIRPLDLFPIYEMLPVWDVKIRRDFGAWDVVSLFNWSDQPAEIGVQFDELGLDPAQSYVVYDCWNRVLRRGVREAWSASVPGHGNGLFAVYPETGRPQLVFSDRHLVTGVIGVEGATWNDAAKTLSGTVRLIGKDATALVIAVPEGFAVQSAQADAGVELVHTLGSDGTLHLTLRQSASGITGWTVRF